MTTKIGLKQNTKEKLDHVRSSYEVRYNKIAILLEKNEISSTEKWLRHY